MKLTAHIPVQQYGFIKIEDLPDDPLEVQRLYNRYAEKPVRLVDTPEPTSARASARVKLEAFVGGSIYYDDAKHEYTNEAGEVYLSGSTYAHQFEEPFDQRRIAAAMAKKAGVPAADIIAMWEMKAEISRGLGIALHAAMEMRGRYGDLAEKLGKSANHDNPMVMEAVRQFYAAHPEAGLHEVLVADHATQRAGRIDRLAETKDGYVIEDFKTDVNIQKKLPVYQKQLSFYAAILEANGVVPVALHVYHWDGVQWVTYNVNKEAV